jgi:hypothetical protein
MGCEFRRPRQLMLGVRNKVRERAHVDIRKYSSPLAKYSRKETWNFLKCYHIKYHMRSQLWYSFGHSQPSTPSGKLPIRKQSKHFAGRQTTCKAAIFSTLLAQTLSMPHSLLTTILYRWKKLLTCSHSVRLYLFQK